MEKESRSQQFQAAGHNHSHDSAIDSDLQEWETEILEIDLVHISFALQHHYLVFLTLLALSLFNFSYCMLRTISYLYFLMNRVALRQMMIWASTLSEGEMIPSIQMTLVYMFHQLPKAV